MIDQKAIEARASDRNITIRSACFCNPGAGELAMGISPEEMKACFRGYGDRITYDDFRRCIDDKDTGAVRVSLGLATNFADVHAFLEFAGASWADAAPPRVLTVEWCRKWPLSDC